MILKNLTPRAPYFSLHRSTSGATSWHPPHHEVPKMSITGWSFRAVEEYVSLADDATLAELDRVEGPALLSLAVRFGATRLIDNVCLG